MHICYVIPAYHASRDVIWLPAIVDTIERVAAVHEVTVIAFRQPSRRPPYTTCRRACHHARPGERATVP